MTDAPDSTDEQGVLSKALKVLAYPISAAAGLLFGVSSVKGSVYDNAMFHDAITDLREPLIQQAKAIGRDAAERASRGEQVDLFKETHAMHRAYNARIEERFEKLGLHSFGDKWRFTQKHQRHHALMNGFTAAGITIGSLLTMANSKTISNAFTKREDEKEGGDTKQI